MNSPIERRDKPEGQPLSITWFDETGYDEFFYHANDLIQCVTEDERILYVNPAWRRALGYSEEEVAQLKVSEIMHPDSLPLFLDYFPQILAGKMVEQMDAKLVTKNGETIFVEGCCNCHVAENKTRVIRCFFRDITEQKNALAALEQSEKSRTDLINSVDGIVWEADALTFQFTFVSHQAERLLGYPIADWLKEPNFWANHIHPEDRESAVKSCLASTRRNEPNDFEYRMIAANGRVIWLRDLVKVVAQDDRRMVLRGLMVDITERRHLEEQFRQAQKMEAIGQLAGGVAHDFNNILAAIMMQADMAVMHEGVPPQARELVNEISLAAERAANLTRQLLAFSRRQRMQSRLVDLNEVVTTVVKMLQRILGEDVRLQLHLHPSRLITNADTGMLDQALLNLAVNARDAMQGSGGRLIIETKEMRITEEEARTNSEAVPGRYVCFQVSDNGCGIPGENLPRIFEPFFTTKDPGKGTGLGLSTVYGVVKQHHGTIKVYSEVGHGTTFQILLPASESTVGYVNVQPRPQPRGGTETILVVEDETTVRMLTRTVLERYGYKVFEAENGVEALKVWDELKERVDLLLTDMVMPEGVNGHDLAVRLKERQPSLKVIFTSGYSAELVRRESHLQEGENFLQKPFQPYQLLETVRRCLDKN